MKIVNTLQTYPDGDTPDDHTLIVKSHGIHSDRVILDVRHAHLQRAEIIVLVDDLRRAIANAANHK